MILTKILTTDYADLHGLFSRKDTKSQGAPAVLRLPEQDRIFNRENLI